VNTRDAFENVGVKPVIVVKSQMDPPPAALPIVQVPLPRLMVRVPEPQPLTKLLNVIFGLLVLKLRVLPPVNAVQVKLRKLIPLIEESAVIVPLPKLASNMTPSPATGADAPLAPPDVAAQLAVEVLSHVPVPPTQNLFATCRLR
jgi:hypothetical protein